MKVNFIENYFIIYPNFFIFDRGKKKFVNFLFILEDFS